MDNLLGRNTMQPTWKLPFHGDGVTDTDYFERVEKTLLSLFETRDCVKINVQVR